MATIIMIYEYDMAYYSGYYVYTIDDIRLFVRRRYFIHDLACYLNKDEYLLLKKRYFKQ